MANALVQFRADESEKIEAIQICEKLGMSLPAYLRICMSRLIMERGIHFSMKLASEEVNPGVAAMKKASKIAAERGIADMTLDEINAEIKEARNNRV